MSERVEWRVFGALRCVNAVDGQPLGRPLHVFSDTMSFTRNRTGLDVVTHAVGLDAYAEAFSDPVPALAPVDFTGWVEDPAGEFQTRAFSIRLPRVAQRNVADSVFDPVEIALLPAVTAPVAGTWAVLRLTVFRAGNVPFPRVLIRATPAGGTPVFSLTDDHGDALVAFAGLPHFRVGTPLTRDTVATLEFIPFPAEPAPPRGTLATTARRLPGTFLDWTTFRATPGHTARLALIGPGQPSIAQAVSPGTACRLTVFVTP